MNHYQRNSLFLFINIIFTIIVTNGPQIGYSAPTRLRRDLHVKFNLNCSLDQCTKQNSNVSAVNLFQVTAKNIESPERTNFIWSTIGGPPMVIAATSYKDSDLMVDWNTLLNSSSTSQHHDPDHNTTTIHTNIDLPKFSALHFDSTPNASIGLMLEKVIIFEPKVDDTTFDENIHDHIEIPWDKLVWDLASKTTYHKDDFLKTTFRLKPGKKFNDGTITIKLAIPRDYKADRQKEVPHLKLNNQSISIVIIVDGISSAGRFKNSLLHMSFVVVVQTPTKNVSIGEVSEPLISDEYTPGVYRMKSVQFTAVADPSATTTTTTTPSPTIDEEDDLNDLKKLSQPTTKLRNELAFFYWKEVAYTDKRKIISKTIDVSDRELEEKDLDTLPTNSTPFYHYFKYQPSDDQIVPKYKMYRIKLNFGRKDSYYSDSKFVDFSFVLGLGAAPEEQIFSFLVKIIIVVCFCLPILVMIAGLSYLMLRKFSRSGDTELLLAAES